MEAKSTPRPHALAAAKAKYAPALTDAVATALAAWSQRPARPTEPVEISAPALEGLQRTWTLRRLPSTPPWELTQTIAGKRPVSFRWARDIDQAARRMLELDQAAARAAADQESGDA